MRSLAMETSLPYNAEWLISHYSLIALVYWSFLPDCSTAVLLGIPTISASFAWAVATAKHLTWWSHLVLAGVAHCLFLGMWNLVRRLLRRPNDSLLAGKGRNRAHVPLQTAQTPSRSSIIVAQVPALLFLAGWVLPTYRAQGNELLLVRTLPLDAVLATACLVGIYALAIYLVARANGERLLVLVVWFLPVLPFLVAGEVTYMCLRNEVNVTFWHTLLPFVYWLTLQFNLYLARVTGTSCKPSRRSPSSTVLRLVAACACSYRLFRTLWTRDDGTYGPPLVYQVLAFVLVFTASWEAAWEVLTSHPLLVSDKRS
jgi:hypothetical protein